MDWIKLLKGLKKVKIALIHSLLFKYYLKRKRIFEPEK